MWRAWLTAATTLRHGIRVHAVRQRLPLQSGDQVLCCHCGHLVACFEAGTGYVRADDQVVKLQQGTVIGNWLHFGKILYKKTDTEGIKMRKIVHTEKAPAAVGPYSQGVKTGNLLFISGQLGVDMTTGEIAYDCVETQTKQVLTNLESIARCLALTIPRSGHLVTSEERFFSLLRDLAQQEGSSIFYADPQSVSPEELASFPHRAFAANVACALEVCRVLGVDRETALKGMRDITPDPGVLKFWKVSRGGQDFFFVNAMAANDLASTLEAWQDPLVQALAASSFMVVLFNNRGDRPFRIGEMAQFIKGQSGIDRVCICGEQKRLVKRRFKLAGIDLTKVEATSSRLTGDRLLNQLGSFTSRPVSIFACGNIKGDGWTIMDYFERNGEELEDAYFASSCHRNGNQLSLH